MHNLLRLGHLASAALPAALPDSSPSSVLQQPQPQHMGGFPAACTVPQPPLIELCNACPLGFLVGQAGTRERLQLPAGTTLAYTWRSAPGLDSSAVRLLRLCLTATAPQPAALSGRHPVIDASEQHLWSEPFDAMAASAAVIIVRLLDTNATAFVAVHVAKVGTVQYTSTRSPTPHLRPFSYGAATACMWEPGHDPTMTRTSLAGGAHLEGDITPQPRAAECHRTSSAAVHHRAAAACRRAARSPSAAPGSPATWLH